MPRYSSRRHQKLMDESEYALQSACESRSPGISRVVKNVVADSATYKNWEARHADLLLPVAEHSKRTRQLVALRNAELQLVHRRALFRYLQENKLRGEDRRHLFRLFHSTLDYHQAVISEHKQYMLAVSSDVSASHLVDVMQDSGSKALLEKYERHYTRYFESKCYVAGMGDSRCIDLVRLSLDESRDKLRRLRQRIRTEALTSDAGGFDHQELLARSGRYPVLNYMVG